MVTNKKKMKTKEETPASKYLKSRGLKNPPLDSGIGGAVERERFYASTVMEEYARLQIEKDRERVKENVRCINEGNINGAGESEEYYAVDLASIDQTPIILD